MATILGYMAMSLDGYIADAEGGIDWLKPFDAVDTGYAAFIAGIDTVVMGRRTYDQVRSFEGDWFYAGKRAVIVTSRPLDEAPAGVEAWHGGIGDLIAELRAGEGVVWMIGGAQLQAAFLAANAMERLDLFVIPVLLGDGVQMVPAGAIGPMSLTLTDSRALPLGMVRLTYALPAPPSGG
ncbi:dihydrofolate reductase family protein [Ancylobacter oerskovii]|uniref:Dihydrofolate reductase family protein n=1 Tax=Ancylobacter oerskovii TaxID=459519 RepID=A0ABW4Z4K2_9HYPH|nr:dihydrofolate reductase family protein [Ancylobacter oerskovii]MBS7545760.1 dihydrofolate reductase [Ancylobacter oerskovii]